jgi:hypothetical protein
MFRYDIINSLIKKNQFKNYLEIGVRNPSECFDLIHCINKDSVDPGEEFQENPVKYKMTSDEFFNLLDNNNLDKSSDFKWDVIFIDGLHISTQVIRDILNSLNHLNENGYIILHDCNPPSIYFAREDYYVDGKPEAWNGTVWKSIYWLRANRNDLSIEVVDTDWGVGIIKKESFQPIPFNNVFFEYNQMDQNRKRDLGLITPNEFESKYIKNYTKKVALISTFCDTQEKLDVLEKNINIVKQHELDVIVISPLLLPDSIIKLCDYVFFTKDNPVLDWPTKAMRFWSNVTIKDTSYEISTTRPDYGFAGLTQVKQLSEIALNFEYDQFYHMIYDLKIDENVIEGFLSNKDCNVYPSKRGKDFWEAGLHYMIFNRDNLKEFISHITLENYLKISHLEALGWLLNLKSTFPYNSEPVPVEDEIFYYENFDFFNYSPTDKFKFFIEKNFQNSIKLLFYGLDSEKDIKIKVNDFVLETIIDNFKLIDLKINDDNCQKVVLEIDSIEYDITEIIKKVKHNTIK